MSSSSEDPLSLRTTTLSVRHHQKQRARRPFTYITGTCILITQSDWECSTNTPDSQGQL